MNSDVEGGGRGEGEGEGEGEGGGGGGEPDLPPILDAVANDAIIYH